MQSITIFNREVVGAVSADHNPVRLRRTSPLLKTGEGTSPDGLRAGEELNDLKKYEI
jgi:hypothetical protein